MSAGQVTARYARALFELAREQGVLERVETDVDTIGRELADDSVADFLFDARVPAGEKRTRLDALAAQLHPLSASFLCLLQDKNRLGVLRDLRAAFRRDVLAERNASEGVVESPRPLDGGELQRLEGALGGLLGRSVELSNRVRPELLAGVRVFIDNKLIDQSAAGRLEGLRGKLLSARLA